jgi:RNA methyltransferase, TrmH family
VVFEIPAQKNIDLLKIDDIVLMLDSIRDPGNMGTIIRIADWYGIQHIICSPDCVDAFNPKVVQASMGSIGRVDLYYSELLPVLEKFAHVSSFAAVLVGENLNEVEYERNAIIIIGNESSGISEPVVSAAGKKISIKRYGKAESLNAAIATAVICDRFRNR